MCDLTAKLEHVDAEKKRKMVDDETNCCQTPDRSHPHASGGEDVTSGLPMVSVLAAGQRVSIQMIFFYIPGTLYIVEA